MLYVTFGLLDFVTFVISEFLTFAEKLLLAELCVHVCGGKSDFVPLAVLLFVILTPYQPQLSVGGGGGGQSSGRGKKDDDDERWKFKFNMSVLHSKSKKPQYKPKR